MSIQVGDRIRDNDPRSSHRVLTVQRITEATFFNGHATRWAICAQQGEGATREHRIRLDRIFIDGKPRRYGYNREPTA